MAAQFTRLNAVMKPTPGPRPPSTPPTGLTRRATLAWAALAVQAGSARAAPEVQDDTWRDTARGRDIPVRLRWPAHPGPWPLLVYSHGLGGSRQGADAWGQAWCEAGFLVLHLQHLGSDAEVLRRSGLAGLRAAGNGEQLIARAADVRAVLDGAARRQRDGDTRWTLVRLDAVAGTLPAVCAVFSVLFLRERISMRVVASIALATLGVMAVAVQPDSGLPNPKRSLGVALVLAAIACEAVFILGNKRLRQPLPALAMSTLMSAGGLVLSALPAWWLSKTSPSALSLPAVSGVLYYAWVPTVLGFWLWYAGSAKTSGSGAALATVWLPVSALLLSAWVLGEPIGPWQWAGLGFVVVAMVLAAWEGRKAK